MNESFPTIGNRFANSIKAEIFLMPGRIQKMSETKDFSGFYFHNLACPCESLVKNWGEQLKNLGYAGQIQRIEKIGEIAREFQDFLDLYERNEFATGRILPKLKKFNKNLQKLVPILFF